MTIVHIIAALGVIAALCAYAIFKVSGAEAAVIYLVYAVVVCTAFAMFLSAYYA